MRYNERIEEMKWYSFKENLFTWCTIDIKVYFKRLFWSLKFWDEMHLMDTTTQKNSCKVKKYKLANTSERIYYDGINI